MHPSEPSQALLQERSDALEIREDDALEIREQPPTPQRMFPVMIRVYENRVVKASAAPLPSREIVPLVRVALRFGGHAHSNHFVVMKRGRMLSLQLPCR